MKWQMAEAEEALLLLGHAEVMRYLDMPTCVTAVEGVFRQLGTGEAATPGVLSMHVPDGAFHVKAAAWSGHFVAKVNANYPGNPEAGLPTIQGLIVLFDARRGRPLAVLDSGELTARRTGAATGVAVKYLAKAGPVVVTLCGCGRQAQSQIEAVASVRGIERAYLYDVREASAQKLAAALEGRVACVAISGAELFTCTRQSDVVITCTTATAAFLTPEAVTPGTLIAAVGADNPHKQEIAPALMRGGRVVTDLTAQCAEMGDLHHALEAGVITRADVQAELGEVVAGKKSGRRTDRDIVVFDSTGNALQDAAAALVVYEAALRAKNALPASSASRAFR